MAKQNFKDSRKQYDQLAREIDQGIFRPVYLLMGEEGYYIDQLANLVTTRALSDTEKEFNLRVLYGRETDGATVTNLCRQYPLMSTRTVVVVKEAQAMRQADLLSAYLEHPLETTLLLLCHSGKSMDKRSALYKKIQSVKNSVVFESIPPRDYEIGQWIQDYFAAQGYRIEPKAVQMLADHLGTDLRKIEQEGKKLFNRLPENTRTIDAAAVEQNIGISKDFNNFELTRALSEGNISRAMLIADHFAANPKENPLTVTISTLFNHFQRIVTLGIVKWENKKRGAPALSGLSENEVARLLKLPSPFFAKEYIAASGIYPNQKVFTILGWLREYDMKSKGMDSGSASHGDLLKEFLLRIAVL